MIKQNNRGEIYHIALAIISSLLAVYLHFLLNRRFYFTGDLQLQFLPGFYEIANLLKSGELPWITLRSWNAGNIAGEYQYGIFNPISLLSFLWISNFENLTIAGLNLVFIHTAICTAGVYYLARHFGVSKPFSALAAFAVATNSHLIYWHAQAPSGFISFVWIPWATYFMLKCRLNWKYILPASISVYLVISSGYPNTDIGLAAIALLIAITGFSYDRSFVKFSRLSVSVISGGLMSLPALYPLIAHYTRSHRADWGAASQVDTFLSATLSGLLSFSSPSFVNTTAFFGQGGIRFGVVDQPFYYAAWFLLIPLVYMKWENISYKSQRPLVICLKFTLAFFLLSMMPNVLPFRWSFKFLPFYHMGLILAGTWILSHKELLTFSKERRLFLLGLCVFSFLVSLMYSPLHWERHVWFVLFLIPVYWLYDFIARWRPNHEMGYLVIVTTIVTIAMSSIWQTHNTGSGSTDYGIPHKLRQYQAFGAQDKVQNLFILSTAIRPNPAHRHEVLPANDVYYTNHNFINGYSSMHDKGLFKRFCMSYVAIECKGVAKRLFESDPVSKLTYADLMRVDEILVRTKDDLTPFLTVKPSNWIKGRKGNFTQWFKRQAPLQEYGGNISYMSPGISAKELETRNLLEEHKLELKSINADSPIIIFARAWHPGYRASYNGKPIELYAHDGFLTAVKLPNNAPSSGTLSLSYQLPGSPITFMLAILGLLGSIVASKYYPLATKYEKRAVKLAKSTPTL